MATIAHKKAVRAVPLLTVNQKQNRVMCYNGGLQLFHAHTSILLRPQNNPNIGLPEENRQQKRQRPFLLETNHYFFKIVKEYPSSTISKILKLNQVHIQLHSINFMTPIKFKM